MRQGIRLRKRTGAKKHPNRVRRMFDDEDSLAELSCGCGDDKAGDSK